MASGSFIVGVLVNRVPVYFSVESLLDVLNVVGDRVGLVLDLEDIDTFLLELLNAIHAELYAVVLRDDLEDRGYSVNHGSSLLCVKK